MFLFFAMLVALPLGGGCGDSDSAADSSEVTVETNSMTNAEFIKRTSNICQKNRWKLEIEYFAFQGRDGPEPTQAKRDAEGSKLIENIFVPRYQTMVDQLIALGAPSGREEDVAAFLGAMQEDLDAASEEPLKVYRISQTKTPFKDAAELAKVAGLEDCSAVLL